MHLVPAVRVQVDVLDCDYMLDLDFPQHPREARHEPRCVADESSWERVACHPFLNAQLMNTTRSSKRPLHVASAINFLP